MRWTPSHAIAAILSFAMTLSSSAENTMDRTAIDDANAKLMALQKQGDAAGMGDMYTEDAILLPAGGLRTEGREAIEAFWAKKFGSGGADVQLTTEDLVQLGDDLVYEIGRYTTTQKDAAPVSGQYLVLWKRVDGKWKLHVDIFNEAR
jgi:uncharacterized protein (TIGR02246 family)